MLIVEQILCTNQARFRKGRSCTQQIHIIRRLIEGALARKLPLFIKFIDCHYGIPDIFVSAIKVLYEGSTSRVLLDGKLSEEFKVSTGVLQGDVLAPFLFIIVIDCYEKL